MSVDVKVPPVGESISSGVVSVWHKKNGEAVTEGEALFTLETDKVSTEVVAEKSGRLETLVPEGQEVKIGQTVARIDDSKSGSKTEGGGPAGAQPQASAPHAADKSEKSDALSPAVRRIVEEEKVDVTRIKGTGKGGRLTKADVLGAIDGKSVGDAASVPGKPAASPTEENPEDTSENQRFTRRRMSPLRRKIAAQLVMAQHTAAILTTFNECDMTAVQQLRAKSQDAFTKKNGFKLGFMSFFIKATVEALKAVPSINGRIEDDDFIDNHFFDIGVAVGTERGLVVPIVRDADT